MKPDTTLATQWLESFPDSDLDGVVIHLVDFEDQVTLTTLKPGFGLSLKAYREALHAVADRIRRQNGKPSITLLRLLDYIRVALALVDSLSDFLLVSYTGLCIGFLRSNETLKSLSAMSALTINNDIELVIPDKEWIESILQSIIRDLDLKGQIVVSLQVDELSDGTAHYPNGITLVLALLEEYPSEWSVDSDTAQGHINNIVVLNNDYETFVFLAAHELRHISTLMTFAS